MHYVMHYVMPGRSTRTNHPRLPVRAAWARTPRPPHVRPRRWSTFEQGWHGEEARSRRLASPPPLLPLASPQPLLPLASPLPLAVAFRR